MKKVIKYLSLTILAIILLTLLAFVTCGLPLHLFYKKPIPAGDYTINVPSAWLSFNGDLNLDAKDIKVTSYTGEILTIPTTKATLSKLFSDRILNVTAGPEPFNIIKLAKLLPRDIDVNQWVPDIVKSANFSNIRINLNDKLETIINNFETKALKANLDFKDLAIDYSDATPKAESFNGHINLTNNHLSVKGNGILNKTSTLNYDIIYPIGGEQDIDVKLDGELDFTPYLKDSDHLKLSDYKANTSISLKKPDLYNYIVKFSFSGTPKHFALPNIAYEVNDKELKLEGDITFGLSTILTVNNLTISSDNLNIATSATIPLFTPHKTKLTINKFATDKINIEPLTYTTNIISFLGENQIFKATLPNNKSFSISKENSDLIVCKSDDFGAFLNTFTGADNCLGGNLNLTASSPNKQVLDLTDVAGELEIKDISVKDQPLLVHIISYFSVDKWLSAKAGIPLSKISAKYTLKDDILKLPEIKLDAPFISINLKDVEIDLANSTIKGKGKAVPLRVVGKVTELVPVVGDAISETQQAVVAVPFNFNGSLSDPNVSFIL